MKNPDIFLTHILESIQEIENYTRGVSEDQFYDDTQKQDAVIRRLEIIGEAVKNLPKSFRSKHSEVPWQHIAGLRDVLIHNYFGIDMGLVWNVVKNEITWLKETIGKLLKS